MSGPELPPALPPLPPNIQQLTAPLIVGEMLGTYLFGVLTVQFYFYHLNFPRDPKFMKWLVNVVFIMDLAATAMCFADMYHWFGTGFGNIIALNDIFLSGFDTPMIGAFIAALVQGFYCFRLWTINKYTLPVCIVVILLGLAQVVAGIYGAVLAHLGSTFSDVGPKVKPAAYTLNIASAVADVLIAGTMTVVLTMSRKKIHPQTDFIVKRIINLTIETNLASTSLAVVTVALMIALPGDYFTAPSIVLSRVYSNSLLLLLNNRKMMADQISTAVDDTNLSGNTVAIGMSSLRSAKKGNFSQQETTLPETATNVTVSKHVALSSDWE